MEKELSFDRIVGGTLKEKEGFISQARKDTNLTGPERFGNRRYKKYILEPTFEQEKAIALAVDFVNKITEQYGGRKIDSDNIYIVKRGYFAKIAGESYGSGVYNSYDQSIIIENNDGIDTALTVVHELLHKASFHSAFIDTKGADDIYRSGVSFRSPKSDTVYFSHADEAIVATLSELFLKTVLMNETSYKEDFERDDAIKQLILDLVRKNTSDTPKINQLAKYLQQIKHFPYNKSIIEILTNVETDDFYKMGQIDGYLERDIKEETLLSERRLERNLFETVLEDLSSRSNGVLTRDGLFDDFAYAGFSGKYLPLARKINKILGKGTFRQIAQDLGISLEDEE